MAPARGGTGDRRLPIGERAQVVAALRDQREPVTYLTFDRAGHGFVRPDGRRRIVAAAADFLRAHP
ncbi:MAG TPA: prolyl oligopeptidase family serine peptidase [Acetobacteraceae bacterium]|nr:prolyl oligopeptidase family serine peptidase [Acetobacteraceae bacterium]